MYSVISRHGLNTANYNCAFVNFPLYNYVIRSRRLAGIEVLEINERAVESNLDIGCWDIA